VEKLQPPKPTSVEGLAFPKINLREIIDFYENLVGIAESQTASRKFSEALKTIANAAKIAYFINWRYADHRLEAAMKSISDSLPITYKKKVISAQQGPRIVFFDSWGLDARGLSLQYLRALNKFASCILFICESRDGESSIGIREELARGVDNRIVYLDSETDELKKAQLTQSAIADFTPSLIVTHMSPWASGAITALYSFPGVSKYLINLTDHAFWLGSGCIDYSLEFRSYGLKVSQEQRGIPPDRTILNPFYPIVEDRHSDLLPERKVGEVVILTGGTYYKMYGRDGFFFDLISNILDTHPNVVIWVAGGGNVALLQQRLRFYLSTGRIKLIGSRKDINSVFKASDIFLATYPLTGGLMAQLATANGVPVLSFTSPDLVNNYLEDIIGDDKTLVITLSDVRAFQQRATTFINDAQSRSAAARLTKNSSHSRAAFELRTSTILNRSERLQLANSRIPAIDYDCFTSTYLEIENYFQDWLARELIRNTTLKTTLKYPVLTLKAALRILHCAVL
jgi:hypothetical protein